MASFLLLASGAAAVSLGIYVGRERASAGVMPDAGAVLGADGIRALGGPAQSGPRETGGTSEGCGRLVINEVRVSGPTNARDEFVELFNAGTCPVALDGWSLRYLPASGLGGYRYWAPPPSGRSVAPGKFFVVASRGYTGSIKDDDATTVRGVAEKGGFALFFKDKRVDSVAWGAVLPDHGYVEAAAAGAVQRDKSLVRAADGVDTNRNAADFRPAAPTPGSSNAAPFLPSRGRCADGWPPEPSRSASRVHGGGGPLRLALNGLARPAALPPSEGSTPPETHSLSGRFALQRLREGRAGCGRG